MQVISATYARNNFSDIISQAKYSGQKFTIKKKGKVVAHIIPPDEHLTNDKQQKKRKAKAAVKILQRNSMGIKSWTEVKKIIKEAKTPKLI